MSRTLASTRRSKPERRFGPWHQLDQPGGHVGHGVDLGPAGRAAQQMGRQGAALFGLEDVQGVLGGRRRASAQVRSVMAVPFAESRASRSLIMAERIRVLAVPSGTPSAVGDLLGGHPVHARHHHRPGLFGRKGS